MTQLTPRSLQGRMLAMSALVTAIALLGRFAVNPVDRRLKAEAALLASSVDRDGGVNEALLRQIPHRFDGWPDWDWRIRTPSRTFASAGSREMNDMRAPTSSAIEGGESRARTLTLHTVRGPVELVAAQPLGSYHEWLEHAFGPPLDALAILAPLLGLASIIQIRLGLRPLRRLQHELTAIRDGQAERLSEHQVSELLPLAKEFNALVAANEATLSAARLSAANLAHALKTPIATLALDVRDNPAAAAQVDRIQATVRHHLSRARMQTGQRRPSTLLASAVSGIVEVVLRLHRERRFAIETDLPRDIFLAIDQQDLDELLGNLIENAARHAASRVTVRARQDATDPRWLLLTITDDGAGMSADERQRVGQPGLRLDECGVGYGFGLAIVRELTGLYGGSTTLAEADGGGLLVQVRLPVSRREPAFLGSR